MKKLFKYLILALFIFPLLGQVGFVFAQSMTILPNSAGLPSQTFNQIQAIPQPQEGMLVYDKDFKCIRFYNGNTWVKATQLLNGTADAYAWSFGSNSNISNTPRSNLVVDSQKNVIVAGVFHDKLAFGNDTLSTNPTTDRDHYIAKFASDGSLIWLKQLKSSDLVFGLNTNLAIGNNDCVFLTANFTGTLFLDNTQILSTPTSSTQFLLKLDSNGSLAFAKVFSSTNFLTVGAITTDNNGNVYFNGQFTSQANIEGNIITSTGTESYICKMTDAGVVVWIKQLNGGTLIRQLACDTAGAVYASGLFDGTMNSLGAPFLLTASLTDVIIVKLNTTNGNPIYTKKDGNAGTETPLSFGLDGDGNIYYSALYTGTTTLVGNTTITGTSQGGNFLVSYTPTGTLRFVNNFTASPVSATQVGLKIDVDVAGNIYGLIRILDGVTVNITTPTATSGHNQAGLVLFKFSNTGSITSNKIVLSSTTLFIAATDVLLKCDGLGGFFMTGGYSLSPVQIGQSILPISRWTVNNVNIAGFDRFVARVN
jgi:hypothetical protein